MYLQVKGNGPSWLYRYWLTSKKSVDIGSGPFALVSLTEARSWRDDMRKLRAQGIDPREHRLAKAKARKAETARAVTFKEYAERYVTLTRTCLEERRPAGGNGGTRSRITSIRSWVICRSPTSTPRPSCRSWRRSGIKSRRRRAGSADASRSSLTPRSQKACAAARTRRGWGGHLKFLLPSKKKVRKVRHHPALPYAQVPAFMAALRQRPGLSARALELCILTASRSGETIGMDWREVDLGAGVDYGLGTIPPERMKADREHRVPIRRPGACHPKILHGRAHPPCLSRHRASRQAMIAGETCGEETLETAIPAYYFAFRDRN